MKYLNWISDTEIIIDHVGVDASFQYETNSIEGYGPGFWNSTTQVLTIKWWEPDNSFGAVVEFVQQ